MGVIKVGVTLLYTDCRVDWPQHQHAASLLGPCFEEKHHLAKDRSRSRHRTGSN